ncbi:MAG: ABC transporter ATP-binding protein [Salinirussus sp.]
MAKEIHLDNVRKEFDDIVAVSDVDVEFEAGDFVSLVGPSGCGKTTTLRMIAGLEAPTSGRVRFDGEDFTGAPPQQRPISMVFQNTALFPHMTCRENIGYGLKVRGVSKAERDERIEEAADILQIPAQLEKTPDELSGGQQQRVALGRAFVERPDVLLLDEPMSDLDAKLKEELRVEIQRLHRNLDATMVYVTHDQNEAMTMSDRIALMDDGTVAQYDSPETLFDRPDSEYVATFIGTPTANVLPFETDGGEAVHPRGMARLDVPSTLADERQFGVGVRPRALAVGGGTLELDVSVDVIEPMGHEYAVHSTTPDGETAVEFVVDDASGLAVGQTVTVGATLADLFFFDRTGEALAYGSDLAAAREAER